MHDLIIKCVMHNLEYQRCASPWHRMQIIPARVKDYDDMVDARKALFVPENVPYFGSSKIDFIGHQ